MPTAKADVVRRFLAYLIDACVGAVVAIVVGVIFPPLALVGSALYLAFKDGIMFVVTKQDAWKNKSIGKRLLDLEVASDSGATIDLLLSAKRNLPLVIGAIVELTILGAWIAGLVGFVVYAVELYFVLTDDRGRRLGDQWAGTQVISTR